MDMKPLILGMALAVGTGAACGSDNDSNCGTESDPIILTVSERTPALGASVTNSSIQHSFTLQDSPIMFSSVTLGFLAPKHTAGMPTTSSFAFTVTPSGEDLIWSSTTIDSWPVAPGHVEIVPLSGWKNDEGCHYKLPTPLFSYDVTP